MTDEWLEYFESIQEVCPWSLGWYRRGRIDIVQWMGIVHPLRHYAARIYLSPGTSQEQLNEWQEYLNDIKPREEWFYSHPSNKGYSTPYPVLIQQSHAKLQTARRKYSHKSNDLMVSV